MKLMETPKVIIFDFDGTIANTMDSLVKVLNQLSAEFGYKKITSENVEELRGKRIQDNLKYLGISRFKLPFIVKKILSQLNKEIEFAKPVEGLKETLLSLKAKGYKLGILTTNTRENVRSFLKKNDLDIFDFIYPGSSLLGKSFSLKNLLREKKLKSREVIYVGDETRDIEAARKINVKVIAVSWGFNSKKILEEQNPDFLIDKPQDLLTLRVRIAH